MASTLEYQYHVIRDVCRELERVLAERASALAHLKQKHTLARPRATKSSRSLRQPSQPAMEPTLSEQGLAWEAHAAVRNVSQRAAQLSEMLEGMVLSQH